MEKFSKKIRMSVKKWYKQNIGYRMEINYWVSRDKNLYRLP